VNDHLKPDDHENDFRQAGEEKPISLVREFLIFIKEEKKWWMIPILLVLAVLGIAAALTSTGAAPFIYTLF
tara:strand:+ start:74975 stop:75187 length:213 start_codon:yes stop_codon:yes gene_type:complete